MATTSRPPASPIPPPMGEGPEQDVAASRAWLPRVLVLGALGLVVLIVAYLLFSGGKSARYYLIFDNGGRLVRGDQVQVGGVPVGNVTNIELTPDNKAKLTVELQSSLLPLHQGTTALIRVPSLTSVADRYIALTPGPNNMPVLPAGSTLPTTATQTPVDLDELFNSLNPATRRGLQEFIEGTATQYHGVGKEINAATPYFSPALRATNRVFDELVREEPTLVAALVEGAKAVSTLAAHREQLGSLVRNAGRTFGALAAQQSNLEAGLKELPQALHESNASFKGLPTTVDALKRLFAAAQPGAKPLSEFLTRLRGLFEEGTQPTKQLASAVSTPGPNNDLTDFANAIPGLYRALQTSSPDNVKALDQSVPITAFFGPYSPDLIGLFNTFGMLSGYRDANGQYIRASPTFADFAQKGEKLIPVSPQQGLEGLKTDQLLRCPGAATQPAADGSSPFTDEGALGCNPSETP